MSRTQNTNRYHDLRTKINVTNPQRHKRHQLPMTIDVTNSECQQMPRTQHDGGCTTKQDDRLQELRVTMNAGTQYVDVRECITRHFV